MKHLVAFTLIFTLFGCWTQTPVSVFDCSAFNQMVTQAEIDAQPSFYKSCILFDGATNYQFDANDDNLVEALTEIRIEEKFHAGVYTNGKIHLRISPNETDFDVAVMNYNDLNNIVRYEKLELGIVLPPIIQQSVDNFVAGVSNNVINPYLDWEMRVYAELTSPSGQVIEIDGFYNKEFNSYMQSPLPDPVGERYTDSEYSSVGGYLEIGDDYSFRIRFAPPDNGIWKCKIHIVTSTDSYESAPFNFNVIQGSNAGYVSAGERFFKLGSETFFPTGSNAPWPETYKVFDPLFAQKNGWDGSNDDDGLPEGYRPVPVAPRVYDSYRDQVLAPMIDNGANMIRTIMYPSCTDIEWEELGNYTGRLSMAQEMDEILEYVETRDAYLIWDMQIHYSFQMAANAYDRRWTWNADHNGVLFCYRDLLGDVAPLQFLIDDDAKKYYKQKLRYILARWGYSTGIGMFELMSEISNIGAPTNDNSDFYKTGDNYIIYRDWQWEMGDYIRSHYNGNVHMQTCSFAGDKAIDDDLFTATNSPFDVMGCNLYDFNDPSNSSFWIDLVAENHLNQNGANSYTHQYEQIGTALNGDPIYNQTSSAIKPMIYAEVGIPEVEARCKDNQIETRRLIWQAAFSGLAGTFGWDSFWRLSVYDTYGKLNQFMSGLGIDFDTEGWHPGAVEKSGLNWVYNDNYADKMIGDNGKADLAYLRSGDGNFALGVITNLTYNVYSEESCFDLLLENMTDNDAANNLVSGGDWNELPGITETINTSGGGSEHLKLKGMNGGNYIIDYFLPTNLSLPYAGSSDFGPNVKIELDNLGDTEGTYIVLFKARKINSNWMPTAEDSVKQADPDQQFRIVSFVEDVGDNKRLVAYPVPSSDMIKVEAPIEGLSVVVSSVDGRIIEEFKMVGRTYNLNVSQYESGSYILNFAMGDEYFGELKIVKI